MPQLESDHLDLRIDLTPGEEERKILSALDDGDCRAILRVLDKPMAPMELVQLCDVPPSTVYRKLNELKEASLVEKSFVGRPGKGHQHVYRRRIDQVQITINGD